METTATMPDIRADLVKWGVTIALPLFFWCIPLSADYTQQLRIFFAITTFVILLIAFDLMDVMIPSILLPTLYFLCGIAPVNVAFGAWTNTTVWMVLGALVLAFVLDECGLLQRIAFACICRCGGTFTGTMYGVFLAGCVVSFITFSQAFIIMIALTYGICRAIKLPRSMNAALLCFAGMLGAITTCVYIYNPAYLGLGEAGVRTILPEFRIYWYNQLLYNGLFFFFSLGLLWGVSKIFHTEKITFEGGAQYFHQQLAGLGPMTLKEKRALAVVAVLMVYLLTGPLHDLPPAYGFMIFPCLLFFPGLKVGTSESLRKINFGVIFFVAGCLSIGIVASYLHAEQLVSNIIAPILAGKSPLVALLLMLSIGALCNLFLTPYAMMAALAMPFAALASDVGIQPMASIMTLVVSTDIIFLPHEAAGYVLMYSFGLISMAHFVKLYFWKSVLMYLFFIAILYPFWKLMGFVTM